ncbi:hypothetical protein J31TS4_38120 [Paenibacillus sp. J31TS4]|uniref:helix-turn-helix domain-containing protein n=1 Tax=Paenibacillus sp. J31TS4 TaxID=2807195 RepID=UPI001B098C09|nr:helix-turn-helix domain-containing protein [Paenibacillus sp. J31TS4]GIP40532.1 hypothetical protein J31TS4_38120 [Paenibacillus sp. J31TS4]
MKRNPRKPASLLTTMLIGFLVILVVSACFNSMAFSYFKTKYQEEIIRYNRLMLTNASVRYNRLLTDTKAALFNLYYHERVTGFGRQLAAGDGEGADFLQAKQVVSLLGAKAYDPNALLDNLLVYYGPGSLVLDKDGSSSASLFFKMLYASGDYPLPFWESRNENGFSFRILPASSFRTESSQKQGKTLLPVAFQPPGSSYLTAAFVDLEKAGRMFWGEPNGDRSFVILDERGELLHGPDGFSPASLPALEGSSGYALKNGHYYFAEKSKDGLTYVTIVSNSVMAAQLNRLSSTLLTIFLGSLAVGLAFSYLYSRRIHRPVKEMLSTIGVRRPALSPPPISEFAFIQQTIDSLLDKKEQVEQELSSKESSLTHYHFINHMKRIRADISEWQDFLEAGGSFTVVLYSLRFRLGRNGEECAAAAAAVRERIEAAFRETLPGSHTFQMETDQILTVVSGRPEPTEALAEVLDGLKERIDRDRQTYLVTAAVSSRFSHAVQLHTAYLQVQSLIQQARLAEEMQILFESRRLPAAAGLSPSQEQELNAALQAGDGDVALGLILRCLDELQQKEAALCQFRQFADSLEAKLWLMMDLHKIDLGSSWALKLAAAPLKDCCTLEEYKDTLRAAVSTAAALLLEKKADRDPVVQYVMDMLNTKYDEDLSLDALADKLGMSSAYLSVYIKEKTGANFIDHLHGIRVAKARELLSDTNLRIQEISLRIGYRNIASFNRMFKKWIGMTPTEYRKELAAE